MKNKNKKTKRISNIYLLAIALSVLAEKYIVSLLQILRNAR